MRNKKEVKEKKKEEKKNPQYEREMYCEKCQDLRKHLVICLGIREDDPGFMLFYKLCTTDIQQEYESQKVIFENTYNQEFQEQNFKLKTVVEKMAIGDWLALMDQSYL